MTRESKAGLLMILMLVSVFGFMVYKRLHPAQALAQQNPDSAAAADDDADEVPASSPMAGTEPTFPENPQVIPAGASVPAPIPDDSPGDSNRFAAIPEIPSDPPRVSDPFGNEFRDPNHHKPGLPTEVPDEPGFSQPNAIADARTANEERRGDSERREAGSAATNELDPFAAKEPRRRDLEVTEPVPAAATTEPADQDPFSVPANHSSPHKRHALPTELDSDPFASSTAESKPESEAPSQISETRRPSRHLPRDAEDVNLTDREHANSRDREDANKDAIEAPREFEPSNASVPVLAAPVAESAPSFEPDRRVPEPAFPSDSTVAQVDQFPREPAHSPKEHHAHNDPFSEPRREETPAAEVNGGEFQSNGSDDRFGGFRPATEERSHTHSISDEPALTTPEIAVGSRHRSTHRPAPISEIDEDFSPRASSTPLVAGDTYQVEPNENFWTISRKKYGTGRYFMALAQHNSGIIPDPKRMRPGVTIATPSAESLERDYPDFIPKAGPDNSTQTVSRTPQFGGPQIGGAETGFAARTESSAFVSGDTHRVEPNENYWTISRKKYGTGRYFMALAQHNSSIISDPKQMRPGVTIATPSAESLERAYSEFIPKAGPDSSSQTAATSTARFNGIENDFNSHAKSSAYIPGDTHRVESSEDFWTISRKRYGTGRYFMALAQHNSKIVPDPHKMRPGMTIATPSAESLEQMYPDFIPQASPVAGAIQTASTSDGQFSVSAPDAGFFLASDGSPMYRIGSEDTLSGIAQRHLGRSSRWVQILEMNRDVLKDGNTLKVGALLRLPSDASRVDVVGGSRTYR